jgi:transposase
VIDFLKEVDENTPFDVLLKINIALKRAYFDGLERELILNNDLAYLKCKMFGKSSEKRKGKPKDPDPHVFDEAKASLDDLSSDDAIHMDDISDSTLNDSSSEEEGNKKPKDKKPRGRKPIPKHFPRVDVIHDLKEADKMCSCGCHMTAFGEDITEQLEVIPASIHVLRHRRLKYSCKACTDGVKIAPVVSQTISKSMAAPGLLAHVAVAKFDDHLPLYRQSEIWARMGVEISRATLSAWILKMGTALKPLVDHLHTHIIKSDYVQADESTVTVLKTPDKNSDGEAKKGLSYMWVYLTGDRHTKPAVVFDYQESREGNHAKTFLNTFKGVLQTDGYSGYHCVVNQDGITAQGCFAHARRKFHDVFKITSKKEGIASKALDIIGSLYGIEDQIKDMEADLKKEHRETRSKPILTAFHQWLTEIKPAVQPKGKLQEAINYTLNQWDALTYYVNDGRIHIDNNRSERQMKPFAVGRKNWLFMGSPDGARAASILYSLIETAKLNGLNPEGYLKYVLQHVIKTDVHALIEKLMPWMINKDDLPHDYPNPKIPRDLSIKSDQKTTHHADDLKIT